MAVQLGKVYLIGDYLLDPNKRALSRAGAQIRLANRPFQLLFYLAENRERLVSRAELLELF